MAVIAPTMTYEDLAEGEVNRRYDMIDGVRIFMSPTLRHQDIVLNTAESFRAHERATGDGKTVVAPRE